PEKSLAEGAVAPWAKANKRMQSYYSGVLESLAREYRVSMDTPYRELPEEFQTALCFGTGDRIVTMSWGENGKRTKVEKPFDGLVASLQHLYDTTESEFTRQRIRQYMSRRTCSACQGARLKPEILAVTVRSDAIGDGGLLGERNIHAFCRLTTADAQRFRLATQIGSGLAGCLYVLDEPSIGLHQRDNDRLIGTLRRLRDLGNSVIVVEHDEDTIRAADHILDLGPGAGARGGQLVAQGTLADILAV